MLSGGTASVTAGDLVAASSFVVQQEGAQGAMIYDNIGDASETFSNLEKVSVFGEINGGIQVAPLPGGGTAIYNPVAAQIIIRTPGVGDIIVRFPH
jgi:hypothetical protein